MYDPYMWHALRVSHTIHGDILIESPIQGDLMKINFRIYQADYSNFQLSNR